MTTKVSDKQAAELKVLGLYLRKGSPFYQQRLVIPGRAPLRGSTKQKDPVLAIMVGRESVARHQRGEIDVWFGKKTTAASAPPTYGARGRSLLQTTKKSPTKRYYIPTLAPSIAAWDTMPITDITGTMCLELLSSLVDDYKPNTVVLMVRVSAMVFNRAIEEGIATKNPWQEKSVRSSIPKVAPRERVLSVEEQALLFTRFREDTKHPWLEPLARVLVGAGLRISEALQLVPRRHLDLDLGAGSSGFFRLKHESMKLKNGKSRAVPMSPDVRSALDELCSPQEMLTSTERLFPHSPTLVAVLFRKACLALKMDPVTPHDLRRTFGTRMARHVPVKQLQRWMGHSRIEITARHYMHFDEADDRRVIDEINRRDEKRLAQEKVVPLGSRRRVAQSQHIDTEQ